MSRRQRTPADGVGAFLQPLAAGVLTHVQVDDVTNDSGRERSLGLQRRARAHETAQLSVALTAPPVPQKRAMPAVLDALNPLERRLSRTIEDDPDADGIADYRVIITDTFDAAGNLESTLREEDFEADGIIDSRVITSFGR